MSDLMVRQEDAAQSATTPTVGRVIRRVLAWALAGIAVVVVAVLLVSFASGGLDGGVPYASDNPAPAGSQAVAEVLRDQGVDVVATGSLHDTTLAVDAAGGDATVLLWDIDEILDSTLHDRLLLATDDLVVIQPTFFELTDFTPGVAHAGQSSGTFDADCDLTPVQKAGTVVADGTSYRITDETVDAMGCLADDDRFGVVQVKSPGATVTLLGASSILTNEHIATQGNAALALNLLGEHPTLVWYIPTVADLEGEQLPTIGELTPPWVTPFAVMVVLVALGAIFWKSRRVGPLVVENLPVVVRASETMEGRARLYQRTDARLHALDALRIGAIARLARTCGLPRTSTVIEVVDAVAALTGRDSSEVAGILIDTNPATDAELVQLSDELQRLEAEAQNLSRP